MTEPFEQQLPGVRRFIADVLAAHRAAERTVASFGFARLPLFFDGPTLAAARVVPVERVPVPPLRSFGLRGFEDLERGHFAGITFGSTYFLARSAWDDENVHFHELVHVVQWGHLGAAAFLVAYARGYLAHGYARSPLEEMAFRLQAAFARGALPFDAAARVRTELDRLYRP